MLTSRITSRGTTLGRLLIPAVGWLLLSLTPAVQAQPGGGCMGGGGGGGGGGMMGGGGGMRGMMPGGAGGMGMGGMMGGTGAGMTGGCTDGATQMMQAAQARQQMVRAQAMAAIAAERRRRAIDTALVAARRDQLGSATEVATAEEPATRREVLAARQWGRRQARIAAMAALRGRPAGNVSPLRGSGT